jgi:YD repeat-containing protein
MVHDPETNAIRYAWCSEDARQGRTLRDGESILLVYAKVLQDIPLPEQSFRLTEEEDRINELYDVNLSRGIFAGDIKAADPNTEYRDMSVSVFPNPFHHTPTLSFYLPEEGSYTISMSDAAGQVISSNTEYREAGQYYWQPETLPTHPGVLFCRLSMGSATRTIRLIQN